MPLSDYEPIFKAAAQEWNLDPNLLKALAAQESGGNPKAVSRKGAQGLMQIIPDTQKYLGITDPNDPVQSIYGAAKYLAEGLDKEKTPEGALLFYHGGPGWRDAYGPESKAYVPGVTAHYQKFSSASKPAAAPDAAPAHSAMSDDDFLKSTGGVAPGGQHDDDDAAFLARTGAKVGPSAAPAAPNPEAGANEYGITEDPQQFNKPPPAAIPAPVQNVVNAAAAGAKEGFGEAFNQSILSPAAQSWMDAKQRGGGVGGFLAGLGSTVADDIGKVGGLLAGVPNAALRGVQGAVAQTGAELGQPQLGRDLAAIPEAFAGSPGMLARQVPTELPLSAKPFVPRTAAEGNLLANFPRPTDLPAPNPLAAVVKPETPLVPVATSPGSSASSPAPKSVGAAASAAADTGISPKQELAYRATAEGQKLLEPQAIGAEDRNLYVQNSNPNSAEIEQSVNTARELKAAGMKSPEVSQEFREIAAANNDARALHFGQTAGSDVDVLNAKEARGAQAKKDLEAAFGNKDVSDATPVAETIDSILNGPRNSENTALQQYIKPLTDRLKNADGTLKSDPEQLYGLREDVSRMMSKAAKAKDPTLDHVSSELQQIKDALDGAIEQGASGYKQYLKNYSEASRGIDQMEVLQKHEPKLFDAQNRMTYNKVQTMMRQIVDSRQAPGINPYKSITDETMQRLWALRDDLRRSASAKELAMTPGGSDTAQNFLDIMKGVGKSGADMAAHGLIASHAGPLGNLVYHGAKSALTNKLSARSAQKQTARGMELLRPKTPLHNPLAEP